MTYEDYRQIRSAMAYAETQLAERSQTELEAVAALHDLVAARRFLEDVVIKAGYDLPA